MPHSFPGSSESIEFRRTVWVNCKIENNVGVGTNHWEFLLGYFAKGRLAQRGYSLGPQSHHSNRSREHLHPRWWLGIVKGFKTPGGLG
jgi:hypothetical protein